MTDLARLRRLGRVLASQSMNRHAADYDDIAQEALIAGWQASERNDDMSYTNRAARNRATDMLRGRPSLGNERPQGKARDPLATAERLILDDGEGEAFVTEPACPAAERAFEEVEARVDGFSPEMTDALGRLEARDRDYLSLRHVQGYTNQETSARLGVPTSTLSRRWTNIIRPRLAAELSAPCM